MFFYLCQGRLEDALLMYSNIIDEPIEVDPALETLTEPCVMIMPFPPPSNDEDAMEEIEQELLRRLGVVIHHRKGKVVAELKSGPTKRAAGKRPVHKPLHDAVIQLTPEGITKWGAGRWPGEQSRKKLEDGALELHLQVPNLDPVAQWVFGLSGDAVPISPDELSEMVMQRARDIIERYRSRDSEEGLSE